MRQEDFLEALEQRLEENKKLSGKGMPLKTAPVVSVLGTKPWQSLVGVSFLVTLLIWLVGKSLLMSLVDKLLLLGG